MATSKTNWKICEFVAHASDVTCAALSPSTGRTLVTGGEDRRLNLWMVGQPQNIMSISGLSSAVESVVFNNTEEWVAAGTRSGSIKVCDLAEDKVVRNISGHKAGALSLHFHLYGDILSSGSMDTNVKLWDMRRKGCIYTYKGHSEAVNAVRFSPDGRWLVSGSSDGTAMLWDLTAGKLLKAFKGHTGAVTDVCFHPKEYLLATSSIDRTVRYWDLELFEQVAVSPAESNGVKCVLFHHDGEVLFSASQDSLRVHCWEPPVQLDYIPISWGKVSDIRMSQEQLIGVSHSQTNVSVWCIDVQSLRPWSGGRQDAPQTPSERRQFQYREEVVSQRPATHPSGSENRMSRDEEEEEEGEGSPPHIDDEERRHLFHTREQLVRTPPKALDLMPFRPPSPQYMYAVPVRLYDDQLSHRQPEAPVHPSYQQIPHQPPPQVSIDSIYSEIHSSHSNVTSLLKERLKVLQEARAEWSLDNPKSALEVVTNSGNQSSVVDLLTLLLLKRSLWTLDMVIMVLPEVRLLLRSKHERFVRCGCSVLKLILKSFSSVIITNTQMPANILPGGVDLAKEERVEKCQLCYSHLRSLRDDVRKLLSEGSMAATVLRETDVLQVFTLLD